MRQALWIFLFTAIVVVSSACTKQTDNMDVNVETPQEVLNTPEVTPQPSEETFSTTTDVDSLEQELGEMKLEAETFQ